MSGIADSPERGLRSTTSSSTERERLDRGLAGYPKGLKRTLTFKPSPHGARAEMVKLALSLLHVEASYKHLISPSGTDFSL